MQKTGANSGAARLPGGGEMSSLSVSQAADTCWLAGWLPVLFPFHRSPGENRIPSPSVMLLFVGAQTSMQLGQEGENKNV